MRLLFLFPESAVGRRVDRVDQDLVDGEDLCRREDRQQQEGQDHEAHGGFLAGVRGAPGIIGRRPSRLKEAQGRVRAEAPLLPGPGSARGRSSKSFFTPDRLRSITCTASNHSRSQYLHVDSFVDKLSDS